MSEAQILVARKNAMAMYEGRRVRIRRGVTTAREGHPFLQGRERLFKPLVVEYDTGSAGPAAPTPEPSAFHPDAHSVGEVLAYLEQADDAERARVLDLERHGKNRKTITGDHNGDG